MPKSKYAEKQKRYLNEAVNKPKKTECSIAGLVIAGAIFSLVGLSLIVHPVAYASMGGTGQWGRTPTISLFARGDSAYIGILILFLGVFVLFASYKIKKG